jgi:hexosaminidase
MRLSAEPTGFVFRIGSLAALATAIFGGLVTAENPASISRPEISATWRLIENLSDNRFTAELSLRNGTSETLSAPWTLYFNSAMRISPESVAAPLVLKQVNGDLYSLRAEKEFPPLTPDAVQSIRLIGSPWAINVSDAPSGLYLIRESGGDQREPRVVPLEIAPFPAADKIRRGGDDRLPVVTPASRFAANAELSLLPIEKLPPIIPTPMKWKRGMGSVTIDAATRIEFDPRLENEAGLLAAMLERSFGLKLKREPKFSDATNVIRLSLEDAETASDTSSGAYTLRVSTTSEIEIVGRGSAGAFYGIQSLRGLMPLASSRQPGDPITVGAIEITDSPRFAYRGLMLDVGRNFHRVETVKRLLDLMAFYKLNRFHWHLSDDEGWRLEIKSLPELTTVGSRRGHTEDEHDRLVPSYGSGPSPDSPSGSGHYNQAEFIDVLRYAHARHIVVVPEFDVPGHSRAAIRSMAARANNLGGDAAKFTLTDPADKSQYESVQGWRDNVMDVGRDATYRFVDMVVGELVELYRQAGAPLEYVHLGGDEVPKGAWLASPACEKIETPDASVPRGQQLEIHFLKRASEIVNQHGATPACWDDCLLAAIQSDWPTRPIVYVWNSVWGWGREADGYQLANAGFDVVLANATNLYLDIAIEKDPLEPGYYWPGFVGERAPFEFNPFDVYQNARQNAMGVPIASDQFAKSERLTPTGKKHVLGIQGQLWAENLRSATQVEYMAFPRMIGVAERAWAQEPDFARLADSAAREESLATAWNEFANALGQRELPRLHELVGTVQYRVSPPGAIFRDGNLLANVAYPGLEIRFTTDGSEPTANSTILETSTSLDVPVRLRAFDTHGHASRTVDVEPAK